MAWLGGALLLTAVTAVGSMAGSLHPRRLGPESAGQAPQAGQAAAPLEGRAFPHLLMAHGPRSAPTLAKQGWSRPAGQPKGNAHWDPAGLLPPSVLPLARLDGVAAMLRAGDPESFTRAHREAKAKVATDTLRICLLRVDFSADTPGRKTTGDGRFDLRRDAEARAIPIDPPPHDRTYFERHLEALSRYYRVMSGGALELTFDVYPAGQDSAYHLADTRKYGPWIFSNSNPDVLVHAIDLVGDALAAADLDPELDFTTTRYGETAPRYNSYILVHAGADFQGDLAGDSPWDIPSFNLYVADPFVVQDSTVAIDLVQVVPESSSQDGFFAALNGVLTHEYGHQVGFTDLYDVRNGLPVVGEFSLMDSGDNIWARIADPRAPSDTLAVRGMLPGSVDPWHKVLFFPDGVELLSPDDFLDPDRDDSLFVAELPSAQLGNRLLYVPLNLSEYLLIENRQWELNGDDAIVIKSDRETGVILGPAPADSLAPPEDAGYREYDYLLQARGLVMWHVDNAAINAGLSTPYGGVNIFFSRPGVRVVEADGIRDIGTSSPEALGGPYDTWYLGGYSCLTPQSRPSSATNDGTRTGFTICALDSLAVSMRLSVETRQRPAGWPIAFVGAPREEQLLALDLDRDGVQELLAAAGEGILGWKANATGFREDDGASFALFPSLVEEGLAGRETFLLGGGTGASITLVAAVAGGVCWLLDGEGNTLLAWPDADPQQGGDSLVTATPVVGDSLVFVGCRDGWIRALAPGRIDPVRARIRAGSGAVRALGVGHLGAEGNETDLTLFWATERGEIGTANWSGRDREPMQPGFAIPDAGANGTTPVSVLAAPLGSSGEGRFLTAFSDGTLDWREGDGTLVPGWPVRLPTPLAGAPILVDADGDRVVEIAALTTAGRLHMLGPNGLDELNWPRSIWSVDETDPLPQSLGPRGLDVTGDGTPEILIHRADGFLVALGGDGAPAAGWPLAFGSLAQGGPEWIRPAPEQAARLLVGQAYGTDGQGRRQTALDAVRVFNVDASAPGSFPVPGVDAGRTRVYPGAMLPAPAPLPQADLRSSFRLYPNPALGEAVTVRFVADRPVEVSIRAYDLSGREVARFDGRGEAGASGSHLRWELGDLAPGLYQLRVRLRGEGHEVEFPEKLAVVR